MDLYQHHLLPFLTDWAMGQSVVVDFRTRVVGGARGRVLEIGIGSGRNLPFYGAAAEEVVGIDPSAELLAMTRRAAASSPRPVDLVGHQPGPVALGLVQLAPDLVGQPPHPLAAGQVNTQQGDLAVAAAPEIIGRPFRPRRNHQVAATDSLHAG